MCPAVLAALAAAVTAAAQQAPPASGVTLSPFVTLNSANSANGASPMAGLALSVSGGSLALRAGGHLSLQERSGVTANSALTMRPWGADADALAFLESYAYGSHLSLTPYVFTGVSTAT